MSIATPFQGSLFANDFLRDAVTRLDDWQDIVDSSPAAFETSVRDVFDGFPIAGLPDESQTEDDPVFFLLYGVTGRGDIRYIYSTFTIVERKEKAVYGGVYRSCELCLG